MHRFERSAHTLYAAGLVHLFAEEPVLRSGANGKLSPRDDSVVYTLAVTRICW